MAASYMDSLFSSAGNSTSSMVLGGKGEHTGLYGSSQGLGNELDREVLLALRRRARAIATSTTTANLENYRLPSKAWLFLYGQKTGLTSSRLSHGDGRLILVGQAQQQKAIPDSEIIQSLPLKSEQILGNCDLPATDQDYATQFEFGPTGLRLLRNELDSFLCTSPTLEIAREFVAKNLANFKLSTELQLGTLCLSWWERRGIDP